MADVVNTEAISKAVVQERIGATPAAGAEAVAREMVKRANESNWREALKFGSEVSVSREDVFGRVDQIGSERDASGKIVRPTGSPEEKRHQDASSAAELVLKFKDQGYAALSAGEKKTIRDRVKNTVLQNPRLASEYNALSTTTEKQAFLERVAGDNGFTKEVEAALDRFTQEGSIDNSASDKQITLEQRTTEQAVKQSELVDVQRRLTAVETRLKGFDFTTVPPGAQAQEMERIRSALPTLQVEAASFQQQMENVNFKLTQLQAEKQMANPLIPKGATYTGRPIAEIDQDILDARNDLQTATNNFNQKVAEINKLPQLEEEQDKLETKRLDLAKEEAEKRIAKGKADTDFAKAQRDLQDALSLRQRQEEEIVSSLENVFSTATRELLDKQLEAYGSQFEDALKHVNTESMTVDQKALIASLEKRWVKTIPKRRFGGKTEPRRVIDEAKVNLDFNTLLASGDQEYIKSVLADTENPATHAIYTQAEIDALMANKDFMDSMRPKAIEQLVARKAVVGGIEASDVYTIVQSSWGKDTISNAIRSNDAFKSQLEDLMGKGAADQPDFMEKLRREAESRPGLMALLAALLAGAGGAVVGAGVLATAGLGAVAVAGTSAGINMARSGKIYG